MNDMIHLPARAVLAGFRNKTLSPVEYLDALIERIDRVEPGIGAIAFRFDERSRLAARRAEQTYRSRSATPRPLEGLPFAIKDDTDIAGDPCTMGSLVFRDRFAEASAPIGERILASGAIPHLRTRTSEFCLIGQCHSKMWGITRNPWNPAFDVGGSSGGSAAALAAGMTPLANGSDVGGSIRIPASCCGVVGYKPPYGRVPLNPPEHLDTYLHCGPMARTVGDAALLLNLIAGRHPRDHASLPKPADVALEGGMIRGMRIAVCETLGDYLVHDDVAANLRDVAARLASEGAVLEFVTLPWTRAKIIRAAAIHNATQYGAYLPATLDEHRDLLSDYVIHALEHQQDSITGEEAREGLRLEAELQIALAEVMNGFNAMLAPTLSMPALDAGVSYVTERIDLHGERLTRREHVMALPFNICSRAPVMSVPSGFAATGVPTGVQIVGHPYDDRTVFEVAYAVERVKPWADQRPDLPV